MLRLADRWVWDFWFAQDSDDVHVFYLQAPRALGDPDRRHAAARIGHAVSHDLVAWTVLPDPLEVGPPGAFDDLAQWTGSIIRAGDAWHLFYTGISTRERGRVQRIGHAVSTDLVRFDRAGDGPCIEADDRWYETDGSGPHGATAWRDPFVRADPAGDGFHAVISARLAGGPSDHRGVLAQAVSSDLGTWEVHPPLAGPTGFGELEVPQLIDDDGVSLLVFCVGAQHVSEARRRVAGGRVPSGTYVVGGPGPLGPFDVPRTTPWRPVTELYAGKLLRHRGELVLMGFVDRVDGAFVGELSDPIPFEAARAAR